MKVFLDYKKLHTDSGKSKFLKRLIPELEKLGVSVRFKPKGCDIALGISKWRTDFKGMPKCLRVDGIHLSDTKEAKWRNEQIRKAIKHSDGVIWQSNFAKNKIMKKLQVVPKKAWVIYNGAQRPNGIELAISYEARLEVSKSFCVIIVSHWKKRKHKRLKEMIHVANRYAGQNKDAVFLVAGEANYYSNCSRIKFLGELPDVILRKYMAQSHVMLNLATYDWCPNAVVEALCMELPVICCKDSGVDELVGNSGIAINNNFSMDEALTALHGWVCPEQIYRPDLFIDKIAPLYKKAFEECLQ